MGLKEFKELYDQFVLLIEDNRIEEAKAISLKMARNLYQMLKGYGHNSGIPEEIEIQQIADKYTKDNPKKPTIKK